MKVTLILLAAFAASFVLRHRSAALRHWVLAVALVCAAAVPLMEAVVPSWSLPIGTPARFEPLRAEPSRPSSQRGPSRSAAGPSAASRPVAAASRQIDVARWLIPAWIAGMAIALGVLLAGLLRLSWLAAHAVRVTRGRWWDEAQALSNEYRLNRPIELLQSAHPSLLVTWGFARPRIVLPASSEEWPEDRVRVVLTHELAHISRGDWLVQLSAEALRAVYWFNPLMWIACRRLRLESERACDDEVINRGTGAADYASHLVDLARMLHQRRRRWCPAPAMARVSTLERRVHAMLTHCNRAPLTTKHRGAVAATLVMMTIAIAAAQSAFVSLAGTVTDEHDRGIAGATVVLTNEARQSKYEIKTGEGGRFEFVGLPAGSYGFEVRGIGFKLFKDTVAVEGRNLQRNVKLQVGSLEETINVVFDDTTPAVAPRIREVAKPKVQCVTSSDGGRIIPPRKIRDVSPVYPDQLRGTGTEGVVTLEAVIGADGLVGDVTVIGDAHPDLAQSAIAAVREWRFTETLLNCQPIEVTMKVTVNFTHAATPLQ